MKIVGKTRITIKKLKIQLSVIQNLLKLQKAKIKILRRKEQFLELK